jgi:hypothetical protein
MEKVKEIMECFDKMTFTKIPKEANSTVDAFTQIASTTEEEAATSDRSVRELVTPSIGRANQIA